MSEKQQRRSPRLQGYDYSQSGAYFVTICIEHRLHLLGKIAEGEMQLNEVGEMITLWWEKLPEKYPHVELDAFVVMPNHFHGVIVINEQNQTISLSRIIQ